jgi:transposase
MSQENANNKPLIRYVNRQQMSWRAVDVERLIGEDHPARSIWTLVGRLDLNSFYRGIESSTEEGGRPAFDPQLLISLWVYAYSQGIGSAREVARRCEYDPAFQWLTGLEEVNYHTLADFRVEQQKELDELFTQVLAALRLPGKSNMSVTMVYLSYARAPTEEDILFRNVGNVGTETSGQTETWGQERVKKLIFEARMAECSGRLRDLRPILSAAFILF